MSILLSMRVISSAPHGTEYNTAAMTRIVKDQITDVMIFHALIKTLKFDKYIVPREILLKGHFKSEQLQLLSYSVSVMLRIRKVWEEFINRVGENQREPYHIAL